MFIENLVRGKTNHTLVQLFRYFFVGGLAFICDFSTLFALTQFSGLHYLWSAAAGFTVGTVVNYYISVSWVFSRHNLRNVRMEFLIFSALGGIGLIINQLSMWFFTEFLQIHYMLSKVLTTGLVFFCNFFSRKLILFRR